MRAKERRQGWSHHNWIRPHKTAQVTAWDCVLLRFHHERVHGIEAVPWEPHCAFLAQERRTLEMQCERSASVSDEVKAVGKNRERENVVREEKHNYLCCTHYWWCYYTLNDFTSQNASFLGGIINFIEKLQLFKQKSSGFTWPQINVINTCSVFLFLMQWYTSTALEAVINNSVDRFNNVISKLTIGRVEGEY